MDIITIYCDGGCRGNQTKENVGGWGVVLKYKDKTKELCGGKLNTTNNQMELLAVIKALESIHTTNIPIEICIDSQYVLVGITQWIYKWIANGWKTSNKKKPVENKELWMRLHELVNKQLTVQFIKVKGHSGVEFNELADKLANQGIEQIRIY